MDIRHKYIDEQKKIEAIHAGASELQSSIIGARSFDNDILVESVFSPSIPAIDPDSINHLNKAASRIARSIRMGELICIVFDFNTESLMSTLSLFKALTGSFNLPRSKVKVLSSNKHKDGLGFTVELVDRILTMSPTPTLVISVNQKGSPIGELDIYKKTMESKGLIGDVISVGDFYTSEELIKSSAFAIVNNKNPRNKLNGIDMSCSILMGILIGRVKTKLNERNAEKAVVRREDVLLFSAIATVVQTNNMLSPINRAVVKNGLDQINSVLSDKIDIPAWIGTILDGKQSVTCEFIRENIFSILDKASISEINGLVAMKFFLSESKGEAERNLFSLKQIKTHNIQNVGAITYAGAIETAKKQLSDSQTAISIFTSSLAIGVLDDIVDKLIETYGIPCCVFTPKNFTKRRISFSYAEKQGINLFSDLDENISIQLPDNEELYIVKQINTYTPKFYVRSTFSESDRAGQGREIEIEKAIALSPRKLFKGMSSKIHVHNTKNGKVCLDLSNWRKPLLYLENVYHIKGVLKSSPNINMEEIVSNLHKRDPKLFSSIQGSGSRLDLEMKYSNYEHFTDILKLEIQHYIETNKIELTPATYVDFIDNKTLDQVRTIDTKLVSEIEDLEPFGQNFEEPVFEFSATIEKFMEDEYGNTLRVKLDNVSDQSIIMRYSPDKSEKILSIGDTVKVVATVNYSKDVKKNSSELRVQKFF
ncbi:hypothetical protein [Photobacterium kishitanii]|uniref:RecJ OB domain-containing protein n=1 Tax=Photobacterium kishitanii TaxID=318456 RepID=A0A2T3KMX2_9GAMM|nr:hypothetical protein [Photobacterium kishitanii]PSV01146.1 hypothetical protein C9J27_03745 [Photobacterium kishitanii]